MIEKHFFINQVSLRFALHPLKGGNPTLNQSITQSTYLLFLKVLKAFLQILV